MTPFGLKSGNSEILSVIRKKGRVHFAGICGAGMTPLALLLHSEGVAVTGTDASGTGDNLSRLREAGVRVLVGHIAEAVLDADALVYSLAVPRCSPELTLAEKRGIPIVSRAELLGAVTSRYGTRIAVAGAHGKSTTVAMLERILTLAELDPCVIPGATLADGEPLRIGGTETVLTEACEYRDSFLQLSPTLSVITNVEHEHVDYFPTEEDIYSSFLCFARGSERVVLNTDCHLSRRLSREGGVRAVTCGSDASADITLLKCEKTRHGMLLSVKIRDRIEGFTLPVTGRANAKDALSAITAADTLCIPVAKIREGLASFGGISRRLERIGTLDGRAVYYDYAHHPTEIECTLADLGEEYSELTVVFRPHTYSRTAMLFDRFATVLGRARHTVLIDIYPAREQAIPGITSDALAAAIGGGALRLDETEVLDYVRSKTRGAVVLMGAGELDKVKKMFEESNGWKKYL